MTARRIRRMAARVFAVAAIALAVEVSAYVRPDAAENGGAGISPPGEERALSSPLASPENRPDAAAVALERRFNNLRRELLDDRAATLDWWLAAVGVFLTFLAIVIPAAGAAAAIFGFRKMREEFRKLEARARRHLKAIESDRDEASRQLEAIKGANAEIAGREPAKIEETARSVQHNPKSSDLDRAAASAFILQNRGDIDGAIAMWRSIAHIAAEINTDTAARAWFSVGYLYQKKEGEECSDAAISAYDKAINFRPDFPEAHNNRGVAKRNCGQYREAIADYDEAIRLEPNDSRGYSNRGLAKGDLKQYREAITDFDNAVRLDPNDSEAYRNRGVVKRDLGQYREAIADFDNAVRLDPDNSEAYSNRGVVKRNLGQYREAIADCDEAIRLDPNNSRAYNNRGTARRDLGQYREAIGDYDEAVRLDPNNSRAYNNRGVTKSSLGLHKEAITDLDEAIRLKPELSEAYNNRGNAKRELEQYREAIVDYDEAIRLKPEFPEVYSNRGVTKSNLDLHKEAITDLDEAVKLKPEFPEAYYNRGLEKLYLALADEARRDIETAIKLAEKAHDENIAAKARRALDSLDETGA